MEVSVYLSLVIMEETPDLALFYLMSAPEVVKILVSGYASQKNSSQTQKNKPWKRIADYRIVL